MFDAFKGQFVSEMDSLKHRPQLAARVGHVIAMWGGIELHLSQLLSVILRADAHVGALLFSVIRAESGRLAMIGAIAEDRLSPAMLGKYLKLQKRVSAVGAYRDAMAHGSWAHSPEKADCLILVDSRHVARYIAAVHANVARWGEVSLKDRLAAAEASKKYKESARSYRDAEFNHIEREIKALLQEIGKFAEEALAQSLAPHALNKPAKSKPLKSAGTRKRAVRLADAKRPA